MAAAMAPGPACGSMSHPGALKAKPCEGLASPPVQHAGPTLERLGSGMAALALPLVAAPLAAKAFGARRLVRRLAARKRGVTVVPQAKAGQEQEGDEEPLAEVGDDRPVEEVYQKLSQLDHVLRRPDTYVGSTERQDTEIWTFDEESKSIVLKSVSFVPALYKIFDEILVNAADNAVRDSKMDLIQVSINRSTNRIKIYNNGAGVPVQKHETYDTWVPELIFGQLLTGGNFDDSQAKVTGGRNGFGAKLANIFSKEFVVETVDKKRKKKYTQRFTNNMTERDEAVIEKCTEDPYTQISFTPDLKRFGMTKLDDDIVNLMKKRVYDMAACTNCRVKYNNEFIGTKDFKDYISLYSRGGAISSEILTDTAGKRWEVGVAASDGQFRSVSFVNSICTYKGGTHVDHVCAQIIEPVFSKLKNSISKKNKFGFDVDKQGRRLVRNHMFLFVKCLIENPTFSSQTKENMTLKQDKFGSQCKIRKKFADEVAAGEIAQAAVSWIEAKAVQAANKAMKSTGSKKNVNIVKLEDAAWAGDPHKSKECTLIITEGDSAKANAVAGLSIVGRKRFGVYPLRGKILNVRTATLKQVTDNEVINDIAKAIGLQRGKEYESIGDPSLRYGSVMLMCDQDHDGSHIKGLTLNLFQQWWPSLLKVDGFLKEFATPIVKAFKKGEEDQCFYSIHAFEEWREQNKDAKGWTTKYYKGLGTSTDAEMKEYFKDLDKHTTNFCWKANDAVPAMDLAFSVSLADERKRWISNYATKVDKPQRNFEDSVIDVGTYVNTELVQFSLYDSERSIPSMVDGLKPSQRKVLYALLNHSGRTERRVSELIGLVSKEAAYHHGDMALGDTIVKMAQNFVGSRNLNLLEPRGQFGTRGQDGADKAAHRYLWTRLRSIARKVFPKEDDAVLEYRIDDGEYVEPMMYCPIIPMSIVNGQLGIGTGWMTSIPNHNPLEIIHILRDMLTGEEAKHIKPWYKNFKGKVAKEKGGGYYSEGVIEHVGNGASWSITEIPIGISVEKFRANLTKMIGEKKSVVVKEVTLGDKHGNDSIEINIKVSSSHDDQKTKQALVEMLGLKKGIKYGNLTLWTATGGMKNYKSAKNIIEDFYPIRLQLYERRRTWLLASLEREVKSLSEEQLFISKVVAGELEIMGRPLGEVNKDLQEMGFRTRAEIEREEEDAIKAMSPTAVGAVLTQEEQDKPAEASTKDDDNEGRDYSHLLDKPLRSLTKQAVERLKRAVDSRKADLSALRASTPQDLWLKDLAELETELRKDPGYADWQPEATGEDDDSDLDSDLDSDFADEEDDTSADKPMKAEAEVTILEPKLKKKTAKAKAKGRGRPKAAAKPATGVTRRRTRVKADAL